MPLALYALAVATFAIGTTEFVVVGLLPGISVDLSVSIATAGLLVSLYALSITLGTPIFSTLNGAIPRRRLAIALMTVFTVCNLSADALGPASGFNIAAFNLGISGGSFIGSLLLNGPGLLATPRASIVMAMVALVIATVGLRPQSASVDSNAA
jgi:MFS transporter, DHA1 family, inner membrane transport protein